MPVVKVKDGPISRALDGLPADKIEHLTLLRAGLALFHHAKQDLGCRDAYFASMECAEIVLGLSGTEARLVISLCEMRVNEALFDPLPRAREDELSWTAYCAGLATMALQYGRLDLRS